VNACPGGLGYRSRSQYLWTPQLDSILAQGYQTGLVGRRTAVETIQRLTGWPNHVCWDRARKLGLTQRRLTLPRRWTPIEERTLINLAGSKNVRLIAQKLNRSVPSIRTRLRRMKLSSARVREGLPKGDLAALLGRSKETIQSWIDRGWLKGRYEGKLRVHDTLRVSETDLLEFWQKHPEEILFHRWNRERLEWFLSLLAELAVRSSLESPQGGEPKKVLRERPESGSQVSA
jgi:transposase